MMNVEGLSLDQLRAFAAVADLGGFSAAARQFGRAQSAITYAVQTLEAQLGLTLFDRSGYRPVLTDAGRALLPRVRVMLADADRLRAEARGLASGIEAEVSIVIETMFPMARVAAALADFQRAFPTVATRVFVETLDGAVGMVTRGDVDLGIVLDTGVPDQRLVGHRLDGIDLVAVAAPGHPLAALPGPLDQDAVRDHLQLVLSSRIAADARPDQGVSALRTWRLTDLGAKHAMLLAGLGWGSMPAHLVERDLCERRLIALRFAQWDGHDALPHLTPRVVRDANRACGPAARHLFDTIAGLHTPLPGQGGAGGGSSAVN